VAIKTAVQRFDSAKWHSRRATEGFSSRTDRTLGQTPTDIALAMGRDDLVERLRVTS